MPLTPPSSHGGGLTKLFDSTASGAVASIDSGAAGFATTFDVLLIFTIARTDEAATLSTVRFTFNNDTGANYDYQLVRARNATVTGPAVAGDNGVGVVAAGGSANASIATPCFLTLPGYAQTTFFKSGNIQTGVAGTTASADDVSDWTFTWRSTTAISRVKIAPTTGNLVAGSRLLIYGV